MIQLLIQNMRGGGNTSPYSSPAPNPTDFTFRQVMEPLKVEESIINYVAEGDGITGDFTDGQFAFPAQAVSGGSVTMDYLGNVNMSGAAIFRTGVYMTGTFQAVEVDIDPASTGKLGLGIRNGSKFAGGCLDTATQLRHAVCFDGSTTYSPEVVNNITNPIAGQPVKLGMLFCGNWVMFRIKYAVNDGSVNGQTTDWVTLPGMTINAVADNGLWEFCIYAASDTAATAKINRVRMGRPAIGYPGNQRLIQFDNGEPYIQGNLAYFTGSVGWAGYPGPINYSNRYWSNTPAAIMTFDVVTHEVKVVGISIYERNGGFYTDAIAHIVLDRTGGARASNCDYGSWEVAQHDLNIQTYIKASFSFGPQVIFGNANTLNIQPPVTDNYDASIVKIDGVWYMAYAIIDRSSQKFNIRIAKSSDFVTWELTMDDFRDGWHEGATIYKIGSKYYAFGSDAGGFIVYDLLTGAFLGRVAVAFNTNTVMYPHPTLIPFIRNGNTVYGFMTFETMNGAPHFVFYEADEKWIGGNEWSVVT